MDKAKNTVVYQTKKNINLTKREVEVLQQILDGKSSKEAADSLFLSKRTIDFHLAKIYGKLQVTNRVQAMRQAVELGLAEEST